MKKLCFLTFNFPRDYALAEAIHAPLREQFRGIADFVWVVESKHAGVPVPEGVKVLVRDFDRGGSLCYTEALHAMTRIYAELADEYAGIVKLDADTYLHEPFIWTDYIADGGDVAYIPHFKNRGAGNGCCYALSARAAKVFSRVPPSQFDQRAYSVGGREDMFFTSLAAGHPDCYAAMMSRNRVSWCGESEQPERPIAAHFGYISEADICTRMEQMTGKPFAPPSQSDYAKAVAEYCEKNGIKIHERRIVYNLDGSRVDGENPPKPIEF